jgi:hypothetical protein
MENFNEIPSLEEVRVIETEDGLKWVNVDDLIMALHFSNDSFEKETKEQIKNSFNEYEKEELEDSIELHNMIMNDLIDTLEGMIVEFDEPDDSNKKD